MAWFSKMYFRWNRVALLYTNDAYGEGGSAKFLEAATRLNLTVLATASFPLLSTGEEVSQRLDRLKKSGASIFMYFGQLIEWQTVMEQGPDLCHSAHYPSHIRLGLQLRTRDWYRRHY